MIGDGRLEEEAEVRQHGTHGLIINFHSREELTENNHVDHERSRKERILAHVVRRNGTRSVHEDLAGVFVESALRILHERHVLNDDFVINFLFALGIKDLVGCNGVIEHTGLRDLLRLEALVLLKVLAVVVTEMVVGDTTRQTNTGANQEVTHDSLEAGLTTLEVATGDEATLLGSVSNDGGHKRVLGRAIQVKDLLLNSGDGVQDRRRKVTVLIDGSHELSGSLHLRLIHHFGVGRPQNDNLIDGGAHGLDITTQVIDHLAVGTRDGVVNTIGLVGSDERLVDNSRKRLDGLELILKLIDQCRLKHMGSLACVIQIH